MKLIFAASLLSFFALTMTATPARAELLDSPELQTCFTCVFQNSGSGMLETETAAWIVQASDGLTCKVWPSTNQSDMQSYRGALPAGVQGLVHSHPSDRTYLPNDDADRHAAEQINGPNYVVSSHGVWKYDPATKQSTKVADSNFFDRVNKTLPKHFCSQYIATHKN
jgi:hypothetical protein